MTRFPLALALTLSSATAVLAENHTMAPTTDDQASDSMMDAQAKPMGDDQTTTAMDNGATAMTPETQTATYGTDTEQTAPFSLTSLEYGETYQATTLIGTRVYVTEQELDMEAAQPAGAAMEWDDIGEIGDMIISTDGALEAVVLDVGGFLGIGEREVAIDWSALRPVREDDDPNEWFLTVAMSRDMLENAPELQRTPAE